MQSPLLTIQWNFQSVSSCNYCYAIDPVVLEATAAAPTFRGFLIQPRLVADDSTVVGRFQEPLVGGDYGFGFCLYEQVCWYFFTNHSIRYHAIKTECFTLSAIMNFAV